MQNVWSRAAQARCLCNCPRCVSPTQAVARRPTTAIARRRLRTGDVFTVFASSLAATAAFVDSRRKDKRAANWDRLIHEAESQLQATEDQQRRRLASLGHGVEGGRLEGHEEDDSIRPSTRQPEHGRSHHLRHTRLQSKCDTWAKVFDWAAEQNQAGVAAGFQDLRGSPLSYVIDLSEKERQELLSNDELRRKFIEAQDCATLADKTPLYDVLTAKKLRILEYSVAKLVLKLLSLQPSSQAKSEHEDGVPLEKELYSPGENITPAETALSRYQGDEPSANTHKEPYDVEEEVPDERLLQNMIHDEEGLQQRILDINKHLKTLRKISRDDPIFFQKYKSPTMPRYHRNFVIRFDRYEGLTNSLHQLQKDMISRNDPSSPISKICFNLLISKTPPNIKSYNMLLAGFCQLQNERLVQAVLVSMRESHICPNEITHSTLLRFYTAMNNAPEFKRHILRMSGHVAGREIATRNENLSPTGGYRYHFSGQGGKYAAVQASMNGEVYESLIIGTLRFVSSQTAMQYYRDMINKGWRSSIDLLAAILKDCCQKFDWGASILVWHHISATYEKANRTMYEWMLYLCQACGQQVDFDRILREGIECGILSPSALTSSDHIWQDVPKYCTKCLKPFRAVAPSPAKSTAPAEFSPQSSSKNGLSGVHPAKTKRNRLHKPLNSANTHSLPSSTVKSNSSTKSNVRQTLQQGDKTKSLIRYHKVALIRHKTVPLVRYEILRESAPHPRAPIQEPSSQIPRSDPAKVRKNSRKQTRRIYGDKVLWPREEDDQTTSRDLYEEYKKNTVDPQSERVENPTQPAKIDAAADISVAASTADAAVDEHSNASIRTDSTKEVNIIRYTIPPPLALQSVTVWNSPSLDGPSDQMGIRRTKSLPARIVRRLVASE